LLRSVRDFLFKLFPPGGRLRRSVEALLPVADVLLLPFTLAGALLLGAIRMAGVERFRVARWVFRKTRVFPVRDHYYEPLVNPAHLTRSLEEPRALPGIEWDDAEILAQLDAFDFNDELLAIPMDASDENDGYYYNNPGYGRGDAEMLYNFLRHLKPRRFIEIGCGMSTRLAQLAFAQNEKDAAPACEHTCIEPYENPWLEQLGVTVLRQRVEDVNPDVFAHLAPRDIVFIDSSHVIRPQGDVVTEYLQILPRLPKGVWVHVHDIATPMDYPTSVIVDQVKLWNEQYLLEAFLTHNRAWQIRWVMNHLLHTHPEAVQKKCPITAKAMQSGQGPAGGCFWMEKVE
jgi:hypothetical protein